MNIIKFDQIVDFVTFYLFNQLQLFDIVLYHLSLFDLFYYSMNTLLSYCNIYSLPPMVLTFFYLFIYIINLIISLYLLH